MGSPESKCRTPPAERQPRVKLSKETEQALSGRIEAHGKMAMLDPYICSICHTHTFGLAVATPCQHVFHRECVEPWVERDEEKTCPNCRAALPPGKESITEVVLQHRQMLNATPVKCPQGCGEVLPFEDLHQHVHSTNGCSHTPVLCGNDGCHVTFRRCNTNKHISSCPQRLVSCELCSIQVQSHVLRQHVERECPRRQERCAHCGRSYISSEQKQHMRDCTGSALVKDVVALREQTERQQRIIDQQQAVIDEMRRAQVLPPKVLSVKTKVHDKYSGKYTLQDELHNHAPVWRKEGAGCIYRTTAGNWMITCIPDRMNVNRGGLRLVTPTCSSAAPTATQGWEVCTVEDIDGDAFDGFEASPSTKVMAAP